MVVEPYFIHPSKLFVPFLPLQKKAVSLLIIDNYDSFTYNLLLCVEQAGDTDYLLLKNDYPRSSLPSNQSGSNKKVSTLLFHPESYRSNFGIGINKPA